MEKNMEHEMEPSIFLRATSATPPPPPLHRTLASLSPMLRAKIMRGRIRKLIPQPLLSAELGALRFSYIRSSSLARKQPLRSSQSLHRKLQNPGWPLKLRLLKVVIAHVELITNTPNKLAACRSLALGRCVPATEINQLAWSPIAVCYSMWKSSHLLTTLARMICVNPRRWTAKSFQSCRNTFKPIAPSGSPRL